MVASWMLMHALISRFPGDGTELILRALFSGGSTT